MRFFQKQQEHVRLRKTMLGGWIMLEQNKVATFSNFPRNKDY